MDDLGLAIGGEGGIPSGLNSLANFERSPSHPNNNPTSVAPLPLLSLEGGR